MDLLVARAGALDLARLLERLADSGLPSTVMMVDNQLHAPGAAVGNWQDVRLRTPAGMVTLKRRPDGIAVIVFGNADDALQRAQRLIADALKEKDA
jgi:hypothetical protein